MGNAVSSTRSKLDSIGLDMFFYYLAFGLYIFVYCLGRSTFETFLLMDADSLVNVGRIVCVLLLALKLFMQRYSVKQLIGVALVGLIALASLYVARDWNLVLLFFFVAAGQGVSVRRLAQIAFPITLAMLLLTVAFAQAGIIDSVIRYRYRDGAMTVRSSMGYSHPNTFGQVVLAVSLMFALLRFPRFGAADLAFYAPCVVACSALADSQTATVCILLVAALSLVGKLVMERKLSRYLAIVTACAAVGAAVFSFFLTVSYDAGIQWMTDLDSLISARFSLAHAYYLEYPPTFFGYASGTVTHAISATYIQHGPDNDYAHMLVMDGIVPTAVFFALLFLTLLRFAREKRFDSCVFGLLVYAIVGITEACAFQFGTNFCLVGMTCVIYGWEQYVKANPEAGAKKLDSARAASRRR